MQVSKEQIQEYNQSLLKEHQRKFEFISSGLKNAEDILKKLVKFQVAIPSWALGTGGTSSDDLAVEANPATLKKKLKMLVCCMH